MQCLIFDTDIFKALNLNIQISSATSTAITSTQVTTDTQDDFRVNDSTMVHPLSDDHNAIQEQVSVPEQGWLL